MSGFVEDHRESILVSYVEIHSSEVVQHFLFLAGTAFRTRGSILNRVSLGKFSPKIGHKRVLGRSSVNIFAKIDALRT